MRTFIEILNDSTVTYVRDLARYGWEVPASTPGWEACSPAGEFKHFATKAEAEAWRRAEVREAFELTH